MTTAAILTMTGMSLMNRLVIPTIITPITPTIRRAWWWLLTFCRKQRDLHPDRWRTSIFLADRRMESIDLRAP
jgi:hypothetical protein